VTDPIAIAAIGTLIVIASIFVTGPYISALQAKISKLEVTVTNADKELESAAEAIQRSYHRYYPAEIKLVLLNMNPNAPNRGQILTESFKQIVHGILDRYVAAQGIGPSQERFKEIERIAIRAAQGDQSAANDLSAISESLQSDWMARHNAIAERRISKKGEIEALKVKASNWRNIAVILQVFGLITVLLKDVVSASS
jgi:Rad3-related DNA helicase